MLKQSQSFPAPETEAERQVDHLLRAPVDTPLASSGLHARIMAEVEEIALQPGTRRHRPNRTRAWGIGLAAAAALVLVVAGPRPQPGGGEVARGGAALPGPAGFSSLASPLVSATSRPYETELENLRSDLMGAMAFVGEKLPTPDSL